MTENQADGAVETGLVGPEGPHQFAMVDRNRNLLTDVLVLGARALSNPVAFDTLRRLASVPAARPVRVCCDTYRAPRVYLAGPMRGILAYNFPAFFQAEFEWAAAGWEVINPARMDLEHPIVTKEDFPDEEQLGTGASPNFRLLVLRDAEAVIQRADAMAFLGGHHNSEGATAEWHLASWLNLQMYYQDTDGRWR